jgi:hypothetical protein
MSNEQPDFYLVSGEMSAPEVVKCWVLRTLKDVHGNDLLLVRVDPPYRPKDYWKVLLASNMGVGLWLPIKVWPMHVYVLAATGRDIESIDVISTSHLTIIDKAGLFQSEADARKWVG